MFGPRQQTNYESIQFETREKAYRGNSRSPDERKRAPDIENRRVENNKARPATRDHNLVGTDLIE